MEGQVLKLDNGNVAPFLAQRDFGLMLFEGTGTLTLSYSLDGEHWDEDDKTFTIPASGYINIEVEFVSYAWYKVESSGTITQARLKYN